MTGNFRTAALVYKTLIISVIIIVLATVAVHLGAQNDKNKLESRKSKLEREIVEMNRELELTQKNKSANLNQLILINKKINKREELINEIEQEVGSIDNQVQKLSDTIFNITMNLNNLKKEYARIIYSTYRNRGATNRLMFIFSSRNFNQAYKRLKYLQQYTEYRKMQVKSIAESQRILAAKKLDFELRKSSKLTLKHTQEKERNVLASEKTEKDSKIKNLTSQEKKLLVKLRENEVALDKLQLAIENLVAAEIKKANDEKARKAALVAETERKAMAENERKARIKAEAEKKVKSKTEPGARLPEPAAPEPIAKADIARTVAVKTTVVKSNSMSVTAEDVALTGSFAGNKGRLPSPIEKGVLISSFGEHPHTEFQNIKIKNNGIDILSTPGTKAKVVFDGEVSSVMFIANLNYVVIVRHGDYLTVYSNLADVTVKKGDKVKTQQTLGTVFTAQGENKARFHFELWQGTLVQNPAGWIKI
ncbi:MAG: peptidoglycan DD-metalloendopeptidase family protein [Bacteroidota bacterium]